MNFHDGYYQSGSGGRGVSTVYVGSHRMRGHGLGSWFSGIFRSALPYLARGARVVGKEALRAGVNILDDVSDNNMSFKESLHNRLNESGHNLKRKATEKLHNIMDGSGYKPIARKRIAQFPLDFQNGRIVKARSQRRRKVKKTNRQAKKKTTRKVKKHAKRVSRKVKRKNSVKKKKSKNSRVTDIFN